MCVHEELLAIIFRLVNFGILIFLCVYAFRRYLLPMLKDQMRQEQEEQNNRQERHKEIRKQEKILTTFSDDQEKLCVLLQERVHRWQQVEDDLMHKRELEKEKRIVFLKERVVSQELEFARQQMLHAIIPKAIESAQDELQKKFNTSDAQHAYEHALIVKLGSNKVYKEVV